jgi:PKD repeat protein
MKHLKNLLSALLLIISHTTIAQLYTYSDAHGDPGITLTSQSADGVKINFSITSLQIIDGEVIDGVPMKNILLPQVFLPNDEGMPNLPGFGRNIALPQGAKARLAVGSYKVETIRNIDITPAPRIPLDTEDGPLQFRKNDRVYASDAFYPAEPFKISEVTQIRGIDIATVGITPFQYNPVTKELLIYRDVELEIVFEGGNGRFGDERLRNRWFDQVLQDAVGNYQSLPEINYHDPIRKTQNRNFQGYEYIIVVPNDPVWMSYAEQIKSWRTKQGIITGIVTLNEVGGNTATILKNYFLNAYTNWEIPPAAVLLMADYGTDATNRIISPIYNNYCVSDNILADMNNNNMPDIIFARMTAQNETHLQTMVSKMLDYEANPPTSQSFYNNPVTALGWQTERWFQLCIETMGGYWREVQNKQPVRVNQIYSGTPGTIWSTATNTNTVVNYFGPNGLGYIPASPADLGGWNSGTTQMITNAINDGTFFVLHRDHGLETGWGEPYYRNTNINALTNTQNNEMPYVYSINCLTGKFNWGQESFAEKFHRHTHNGQNAGALGVLAASEISYSFVNDCYVWGSFDNMQPDFMPDYGLYVDERGYLPAFGNAAGKYFLQQSQWPYNTNNKLVTYHLFHHHGGAFMKVYSEVPQNLTITHEPIFLSGQTNFSITANAGAYIALTADGQIIGRATGTGAPLSLSIPAQQPGVDITVTVTKQNFFRYEADVEVIPMDGPYIVADDFIVNDQSGNNNGQMDYGETILLTFSMKNLGNEAGTGINATISTDDPFINITNNTAFFGSIPSQQSVTLNDAFTFVVSEEIPDGHSATFSVLATDNISRNWTSHFNITGNAPALVENGFIVHDATGNNNGVLDPGETVPVSLYLKNDGGSTAHNVSGTLTTSDPYLTIHTSEAQQFGDVYQGQSKNAGFIIGASSSIPLGYSAVVTLLVTADMGITQQTEFEFNFSDYCYPTANCSWGDGFTGFALGDISNMNSGCSTDGFGDFTHLSTNLESGQTYTLTWKTGYQNQYASLWIDLNSDKEFSQDELLIADFHMVSSNTSYTTSFTVPENVHSGTKRLRIRANWQNSSTNPCANFTYGETEDYSVSVQGAVLAAGFSATHTTICESGQTQFIDQTFGSVEEWLWEFPGGTPAASTLQNPVVTYPSSGIFDATLTVTNNNLTDQITKTNFITVHQLPGQPIQPNGAHQFCQSSGTSEYTINEVPHATDYHWTLTPVQAGTINGNDLTATVEWNSQFYGEAEIIVSASNTCGAGTASEPLQIVISPIPSQASSITGETMACNSDQHFYTTQEIEFADEYIWEIIPGHAGTTVGNSTTCTIEWADDYEGTASLRVAGVNICGTGSFSSSFAIIVVKCMPDILPYGWDLTKTTSYHPILLTPGTVYSIFGDNLPSGSHIGVFYLDENGNEVCGGARVYVPGKNNYLAAFGNDNTDGSKNGFDQGEVFRWRIVAANTLLEHPAMAIYCSLAPNTTGTYANTGFSEILILETYCRQVFNFTEGWSGFSIPFNPFVAQADQLFADILDQLIIMQNDQYIFWPGQGINTFPGWQSTIGVQLKVTGNTSITVNGMPGNTSVSLPAGWSFLPVISPCNVSAGEVFAGLGDAIHIVKSIASNEIYWPQFGVYSLEVLETGQAYLILMDQAATITFPECTGERLQPAPAAVNHSELWNPVTQTPGTHVIAISPDLIEDIEPGDYIGAFTSEGLCAGSLLADGTQTALVVYGDDPLTSRHDGFAAGEKLNLRILKSASNTELDLHVTWDVQLENHTGHFVENGLSSIKYASTGTSGIDNGNAGVMIYPNPAEEQIQLTGLNVYDALSLTSVTGRTLFTAQLSGQDVETIDVSAYPRGIYLIRLTGDTATSFHKIILK